MTDRNWRVSLVACARLVVPAALLGVPAMAGTYQHTLQDADTVHRTLGLNFPYVVEVSSVFSGEAGSGVLIDPWWVVTAAHVVDEGPGPGELVIGGALYQVAETILHPDWNPGDPNNRYQGKDIALIRLAEAVLAQHAEPVARFRGTDEIGQTTWIVGYGRYGNGLEGWVNPVDSNRRAGRNVIDLAGSGWNANWSILLMVADFDNPEDAGASQTGSVVPDSLEFHEAPGDSGGGWLVEVGGTRQLAGVAAFVWPTQTTDPFGRYGELSVGTRIAPHNFWIDTYALHEKRWKYPASGMWTSDGNWDYESPHSYQDAVFDVGGTYTVTMPSGATTRELRVENGAEVALAGSYTYGAAQRLEISLGGELLLGVGADVSTAQMIVGGTGAGTMTQTGGSVDVQGNAYLGVNPGAVGTYELVDGHLHVAGDLVGGAGGSDEFILDAGAGALDVAGDISVHTLTVGHDAFAGVISTLDVTHGHVLTDNLVVARDGRGQVTQIGGENDVTQTLAIGLGATGEGTYTLAGGTVRVNTITVGIEGAGTFNWSGGELLPYSGSEVTVRVCYPRGRFNFVPPLPSHVTIDYVCGDCNTNGIPDACDLSCEAWDCAAFAGCGQSQDCNTNGVPDECDIANHASLDVNDNDIPDECEGLVQWAGNGHYYRAVLVPGGLSWSSANAAAVAAGGHLATVTSEAENTFVYNLVADCSFWYSGCHVIGPWLGGYQVTCTPEPSCGWRWVTGEPFPGPGWIGKWRGGEPNNAGGLEDSMHFYYGDTWNDVPNDPMSLPAWGWAPHGYIIEFAAMAGDIDGDENVDIGDFNALSACMNGPGVSLGSGCHRSDLDDDGDGDLSDFASFQTAFTGSGY